MVKQHIAAGKSFHEALQAHPVVPMRVVQLVRIGEASGQLDHMLSHLAVYYQTQVDQAVAQLGELLEPVVMLVLGGLVGVLVVAMYLPLFQLSVGIN